MNKFLRSSLSGCLLLALFAVSERVNAGSLPMRTNGIVLKSASLKKAASRVSLVSNSGSGSLLSSLLNSASQINVLSQIEYAGGDVPTTVTVTDRGTYQVWVFVNDYLGYVSPKDGSLLHCERYRIPVRLLETPLIDCSITGNIEDIPNFTQYPESAGGGYLRFGDEFFYAGNTTDVLRTGAKHWKYRNGNSLYESSQGIWRWSNGNRIADTLSANLYYPSGSLRIYSVLEGDLRYMNGFYFSRRDRNVEIPTRFDVRYPDGFSQLVRASSNVRFTWYPPSFVSSFFVSRLENQDRPPSQRVTMHYPSGSWTLLKQDTDPYEGATYDTNANPTFLVSKRYTYEENGFTGEVVIDADPTSDYVGIFQYEQAGAPLVHAVIQNRIKISPPEDPKMITTAWHGGTLDFSWTAASPASTPKYLFVSREGFVAPTLCEGGTPITNTGGTITYPLVGVTAGKTYSARICGWDPSTGRIGTGTPWTVTLTADPPAAPKLWVASPGTLTTLRVFISPGDGGGPVKSYRVSVREGTELSPDWAKSCADTADIGSVESYTLPDLKANQDHWVKVCAIGEGDQRSLPGFAFGRTDSDVPYAPRSPLTLTAFTDRTIGIRWSTLSDSTPKYQGSVGYRVSVVPVPADDPALQPPSDCGIRSGQSLDAGGSKQLLIGSLSPGTFYRIRVCALSGAGEVSVGNPVLEARTAPAAMTQPVMFPVQRLADGSVRVRFQAPQGTTSGTAYTVLVRDELATGAWSPAAAISATIDGQILEWVDHPVPGSPARFYQVRR